MADDHTAEVGRNTVLRMELHRANSNVVRSRRCSCRRRWPPRLHTQGSFRVPVQDILRTELRDTVAHVQSQLRAELDRSEQLRAQLRDDYLAALDHIDQAASAEKAADAAAIIELRVRRSSRRRDALLLP